jgi:phospholipid/cholesterol/gamma-HCH transport system permease protein
MLKIRTDTASAGTAADEPPAVEFGEDGDAVVLTLTGTWTTRNLAAVDGAMRKLAPRLANRPVVIDLAGVRRLDTAGAWVIERLLQASASGGQVSIEGATPTFDTLIEAVRNTAEAGPPPGPDPRLNALIRMLESVGRSVYSARDDFLASMNILGATIKGGQLKLGRGHGINFAAIFNQIDRMGVGAVPVILLMSSIVGAIVAQQGAFQLRYFGADIFVVDLVGILVLRELGVLMTAIMIAGRSGSAITAEIGSMKMREEVDALTVIGLNPVGVLVFPRLVALVIALPCLTILANFAAIGGAIGVTWLYSNIPPAAFIDRLRAAIDVGTIFAGLIKAPFMAMIIGIIASVEGMKVGGSAESLGQHVTASVVKSIFVVVILDGLFAIFFAQIDF